MSRTTAKLDLVHPSRVLLDGGEHSKSKRRREGEEGLGEESDE